MRKKTSAISKKNTITSKIIILLFCIFLFCSCKNHKKIDRLNEDKDVSLATLSNLTIELQNLTNTIKTYEYEREIELKHIEEIKDSLKTFVLESPMATAYIKRFDKQPILILQEYFNSRTEDELTGLMVSDLILILYADNEESRHTIAFVRQGLQSFDQKMKKCINNAQTLQSQLDEGNNLVNSKQNEQLELSSKIKNLEKQIDDEENKGWL